MREPIAAVLPPGHRLAAAESLTLADLAQEPWVLTARSTWPPWHEKYDRDFAAAGFARTSSSGAPVRRTCSRWSRPGSG